MNILIVGEFSAFAKELKKGFVANGHSCIVFSWGDGAKSIKQDSDDYSLNFIANKGRLVSIISRIWMNIKLEFSIRELARRWKADIVLIINASFTRSLYRIHHTGLTISSINRLKTETAKIYLSACGTDFMMLQPVTSGRIIKPKYPARPYSIKKSERDFNRAVDYISGVIPTHYDYARHYRDNRYMLKGKSIYTTIPLPIDVNQFSPNNKIKDIIVIFLGKMRPAKGYDAMDKAVDIICQKYENVVRIPNRFLPINEYFNELSKANIVLDQCTGFSYGMNALYAMAMGKCLLTNNEPEGAEEYGLKVDDIPIINIKEDVSMIVDKLSALIESPDMILDYGKRARLYVEKFHDSKYISKKYLDIFES